MSELSEREKKEETAPKVKIAFNPAGVDACALWRTYMPHLNISGSTYIYNPKRLPAERLAMSEVVVVQRQCTPDNHAALKYLKQVLGIKIIYDLDDNLWDVPDYNPAKFWFQKFREGFGYCAQLCDLITVSTSSLKRTVQKRLPELKIPIEVIPNAVDFEYFGKPSEKDEEKVIIGWAGSNTHSRDCLDVWQYVLEVIEENKNVYLEIVGGADISKKLPSFVDTDPITGRMKVIEVEKSYVEHHKLLEKLAHHPRIKVKPWVPVGEYNRRFCTWSWDIVLAPLENNRFNFCKSNVKLLETAAIDAVFLASDVTPYNEFVALDDELKSLLCFSSTQWKRKLTDLVKDAAKRKYFAHKIKRIASTFYNISEVKKNWVRAAEQLCGY